MSNPGSAFSGIHQTYKNELMTEVLTEFTKTGMCFERSSSKLSFNQIGNVAISAAIQRQCYLREQYLKKVIDEITEHHRALENLGESGSANHLLIVTELTQKFFRLCQFHPNPRPAFSGNPHISKHELMTQVYIEFTKTGMCEDPASIFDRPTAKLSKNQITDIALSVATQRQCYLIEEYVKKLNEKAMEHYRALKNQGKSGSANQPFIGTELSQKFIRLCQFYPLNTEMSNLGSAFSGMPHISKIELLDEVFIEFTKRGTCEAPASIFERATVKLSMNQIADIGFSFGVKRECCLREEYVKKLNKKVMEHYRALANQGKSGSAN